LLLLGVGDPRRCRRPFVTTAAVKQKTGRQVACSKTLVAKPEHADKVAEMLQAVVREHYGPLSNPPARRRASAALPLVVDALAEAAAASSAAADSSPQQQPPPPADATTAVLSIDPDLPRLLAFHADRDQWERNVFHLWLQAPSNEALGRIDTAPRAVAFMRDTAPLLERPVGMCMYTLGPDGSLGAPAMQGGPKGEGGLDDATGASGMVGGAGVGQTSAALAAMVAQAMNEHGEDGVKGGAGGGKGEQGLPPLVVVGAAVAVGVAAAAAWWWLGGGGA
jgi:hypothetical protein